MRVLVVGPLGPDSPAENLATSLQDLGHDARGVETWDWDARLSTPKTHASRPVPFLGSFELHAVNEMERRPRLAARLQARVLAAAEEHRPELTIVMDRNLSVHAAPRLRAESGGSPVALWFTDSLRAIGRETHLLGGYDAVFVTDEPSARRYRDLRGLNAHLMPEACNPRWHRPPDGAVPGDAGKAVLILGSVYTSRYLLLRRLFDAGIEIELRGGHVSRVIPADRRLDAARGGPAVAREAKARAFRRAAVVLNDVNTAETSHLNLRLFEASGSGGAIVTEWRDGLPDLFEPGAEVHAYRTFDELLALIRRLQGDPEVALAAGDAARKRAHAEHTWGHRFDAIVDLLGRG
jgi:spore maturation protein CgeB